MIVDGHCPLVECDHCLGHFLPEDMDGDHCAECADFLFGDNGGGAE